MSSLRSLVLSALLLLSLVALTFASPSSNVTNFLATPYGLVYDGHGFLYTAQTTSNNIVKMSTAGAVVAIYSFNSTGYYLPRGLDVDAQGNLYVAFQLGPQGFGGVVKFAPNGTQLAVIGMQSQPFGVTVDAQQNIWIADSGENAALEYTQAGVYQQRTPGIIVYSPHGIASDINGVLYIMSQATNVNPSGYIIKRALNGDYSIFASGFSNPEDIVVDYFGNVFVADTDNQQVVMLAPNGTRIAIFKPQDTPFNAVTGVAVDEFGTMYAADYNNGRVVRFPGATGAIPQTGPSAYFCSIIYGLAGTVDYPWSSAISMSIQYNSTVLNTAFGPAVRVLNGAGTRVYTDRFGVTHTTAVTVASGTDDLLYLTNTMPFDNSGLTLALATPFQLPGAGLTRYSTIALFNGSYSPMPQTGEGASALIDSTGEAFVSTVPGFLNKTIGASNANALAVNYGQCTAGISFINGLRAPIQPSQFNGAVRSVYTYFLTDAATYSVQVNLTLTATSAFANPTDQLNNQYQIVANIAGTHTYTALPSGVSTVSQVRNTTALNLFFPYSLIVSSPGTYTQASTPFLNADGLTLALTPASPASTVRVFVGTSATGFTGLQESGLPLPVASLTQQTYTLLQPL